MKFTSLMTAVTSVALLTTGGNAQTGSNTTNSQSRVEVQAGRKKVSADTKQETKVGVQQGKGKAEVKTNAQSQTNTRVESGNSSSLNLANGTQLQAMLQSTIDSKRVAEGQQFFLKTTKDVKANGQKVVKKGSTLVGHVVAAQSKAEGNGQAEMTLMIDGVRQGNQIIPVQAMFVGLVQHTTQVMTDADFSNPMPTMSAPQSRSGGGVLGGDGLVGSATGAVNRTLGTTTQTVGHLGSTTLGANGTLATTGNVSNAGGLSEPGRVLFSLQNGLTATSSSSTSGATEFTRRGKDVKLEKGTEFLLVITNGNHADGAPR